MIRIYNATKSYGEGESAVAALRGVSLEVPAGQFVALMGPSGCGKSTLLHILGGLDTLEKGEVYLDERPIHRMGEHELTLFRREKVGIVFQSFNLLPTLTVEENVMLPGLLSNKDVPGGGTLRERTLALLDEVGLGKRARHMLHQLSGGETQRAALARALLLKPPVLLADEPTGNLDSEASANVVRMLRELGRNNGTTIVMVTHSREVAGMADRLVQMRDGKVVDDPGADTPAPEAVSAPASSSAPTA
ncbi:lipoprotein-releasing system ATP-binding protein LolD [Verrucomicrobia bacterium LW23]|nr:lipoprotein-releasing system ATP-binding protein LolD [Verrucomicrobia bacterium LW23]